MPLTEFAGDNSHRIYNPSEVLPERLYDAVAGLEGRRVQFAAGTKLFIQGSMGYGDDTLYVIIIGSVNVIRVGENGAREIQARVGGRGAIVGEIRALNLAVPRTRTVEAAEDIMAIRLYHGDLTKWNGDSKPRGEIHAFITDLARRRFESFSKADREMFGLDDLQWGGQRISPPPTSITPRLPEPTGGGALARRIERGPLPNLDPPRQPIWFRSSRRPQK